MYIVAAIIGVVFIISLAILLLEAILMIVDSRRMICRKSFTYRRHRLQRKGLRLLETDCQIF